VEGIPRHEASRRHLPPHAVDVGWHDRFERHQRDQVLDWRVDHRHLLPNNLGMLGEELATAPSDIVGWLRHELPREDEDYLVHRHSRRYQAEPA